MDDLCLFGISFQITSYTITEAHADSNQYIALLLLQVHGIVTMHTQHTHIKWMV